MKTRSDRFAAVLRVLAALLLALVPSPIATASAGPWRFVAASASQAARGVQGYEEGIAALEQGHVWACQVVGEPSVAGLIRLRQVPGGVRIDAHHQASGDRVEAVLLEDGSMSVLHDGVQVATHLPSPAVGVPGPTAGHAALRQLSAWQVLAGALTDANLQGALQLASGGTAACRAACDSSVAVPARCVDENVDEACCLKLAQLRRCYAYCECDAAPSNSAACRLAADAAWASSVAACGGLFGEPMEP